MRAIIAVTISVAFGAVLGAFIIRSQMNPKLMELAQQRVELEQEKMRMAEELSFASERMQWMEKENTSLRSQIQSLSNGQTSPVEYPAEPSGAETDAPVEGSVDGSTSTYIPPDPSEAGNPSSPKNPKFSTPEEKMEWAERQMRDNVLTEDMEKTTDPEERARLQNVIEHRNLVRDLYRDLRDAATPEERQMVLDTILKARSNLKELVKNQQDEMIRQAIESTDDSTEEGKRALVDKLQEIQKSPYFTDPLLVWGMSASGSEEMLQ